MPQARTPLLPGSPLVLGGEQFIMPALSVGDARRHWSDLEALQSSAGVNATAETFGVLVKLVTLALRRNYPDATESFVEDNLGFDDVLPAMGGLMGAGAFKKMLADLGREPGNAVPQAQVTTAGTGAESMPPSPLPPVGDSPTSTS